MQKKPDNNTEVGLDASDHVVLDDPEIDEPIRNQNILNLPVQIIVSVGKTQLTVNELLALTRESIIDLDAKIHDPAEIYVGDRVIARGELVDAGEGEHGLGIRLVEICDEKP